MIGAAATMDGAGVAAKDGEKKKSTGRKKIEIKKLTSKEKRQVTFSKRRHGLIKKASELCILCGSQIAIFTTSPVGNKVFSFGHPSADIVVDRYLEEESTSCMTSTTTAVAETAYNYAEAMKYVEMEKKKKKELGREDGGFLWENKIEEMESEELEMYMEALEDMGSKLKMTMTMISVLEDDQEDDMLVDSFLLPSPYPELASLLEGEGGGGEIPVNAFGDGGGGDRLPQDCWHI